MTGTPTTEEHLGSPPPAVAAARLLAEDADRVSAARRLSTAVGRSAALDRLADIASRLLGTASAHVSMLTDVHVVSGGTGLLGRGMGDRDPLPESLCTLAAVSEDGLVVQDARVDERVRDLPPVVTGEVRSYLGMPLRTEDGHVVGAL